MPRLLITGFLVAIVAIFVATAGFLAYGYSPARSGDLSIDGLEAPVQIGWDEGGIPWIQAASAMDAAAALGYVHGVDRSESMVLWRQAALGRLNVWEGSSAIPLDLFARRLGFERLARDAYQKLSGPDRKWLDAYISGVNRALETPGVRYKEAFIRQGITPELWEPVDALAVERLMAYLATPPVRHDSAFQIIAARDSAVLRFAEADSLFRSELGLWGWQHGRAYATSDGIVYHQPLGDAALPVLGGVVIDVNGNTTALGIVPGTPIAPFGYSVDGSWAIVLSSRAGLERAETPLPPPTFERLVAANGDEELLRLVRDENGLVLNPRTGWRLSWQGFSPRTDLTAWRMLRVPNSTPPSFSLFRGAGVLRVKNHLEILGAPLVRAQSADHVFAAEHPSAVSASRRLERVANAPIQALAADTRSPWAASRLSPLLQHVSPSGNAALSEPLAFLQGWDHRFSANAVAPALFEYWLNGLDEVMGSVPQDSVLTDWRLPLTLGLGTAMLKDAEGASETNWRWREAFDFQPRPPLGRSEWTCQPFSIPEGHPTTLLPGPSLHLESSPGPAMWSAWVSFDDASWSIRRPLCAPEAPAETPIQTVDLQAPPEVSLTLVPG